MSTIRARVSRLSPPQILTVGFLLLILIGSLLLWAPISSPPGKSISYIDALFTSASATCVTGLVVADTANDFTLFGQLVILVLIQLGGLGFMTSATWFALMLGRRISLRERIVLKESMNQTNIEGIVRLTKKVFTYSLSLEGIGALLYAWRWSSELPFGRALYFGVFHAVSLFNNAGFELFGGFRSMTMYVDDILINIVSMLLVVSGGIGFIVMSDLIEYRRTRRLSLHSKVVLTGSSLLIGIGALVIFIFEYTNPLTLVPLHDGHKAMAAMFQSVSLRSSGTNTIDIAGLRQGTQFFMIVLMFIGAAPGSTGGGIKITSFAILLGAVFTMVRGREDVQLFRYRISQELVYRATTFTILSVFLISIATMVMSALHPRPFLMILFEVVSAFGTVGLSMGLTPDLTAAGKWILIFVMFLGRVGPVTLAFALQPKHKKELYRHPEGKLLIG
ncbi:TrkH family potassium uptake protein [Paenibacillus sp. HJGM_3]|uniref:TrkH family potassium uptake protein n=1 Tax=Paenibacillus sp. HJGM_3 TaxID=3379816 RepID=UPI00385BD944